VTADEVYGNDGKFRNHLEGKGLSYVLAVASNQHAFVGFEEKEVSEWGKSIQDWEILSAGEGSKGPREYEWARIKINGEEKEGCERWLLFRRSLKDSTDIAYYRTYCPIGTDLQTLVSIAGKRWCIETSFELAKKEVGLDHYEVRKWKGWYRHITLCLIVLAYLTVLHLEVEEKGGCLSKLHQRMMRNQRIVKTTAESSMSAFKKKRGL
jgi:SRSO17 transposase